ncbi:hypothetical protein ANO14919_133700 [Xylariales sp. No.14919]|nr:hypothetical protein ANO14919_133700 [Xylariales sp. No.14919]
MCQYWATTFPCGCASWRSSGYEFCAKRGTGKCKVALRRYVWKTFCPHTRKEMRNKTYVPGMRLAACCRKLDEDARQGLCRKCDSVPTEPHTGPARWHCPKHVVLVEESDDVPRAEAERFFERSVVHWALDHQRRYYRRKEDKRAKKVWWSY